jgi:hypothetical protein
MIDGADGGAARGLRVGLLFLAGSAVFAAAYCQAPLYYSNQNQYFLHGLGDAGQGLLHEDWLATTRDPTPAFTALVSFTARHLPAWTFHVYYPLLLGAYAAAMLGLFVFLAREAVAARRWPVFVALLVAVHSALGRWCSYRWFGQDYPWFSQAGVAGQYVLGAYLQPSAFGVLLVVAVCLFVRGRVMTAGFCCALAATVHPSYVLPAALLTLGFLAVLVAEGRPGRAAALGALTLALVAPVTVSVLVVFRPTSAADFAQAQDVLVNLRIPHHSRFDRWLDVVAVLQIGWIFVAVVLVRRTRLFLVLAVPFGASALLTLAQVLTGSHTLALLFPWRVSAVLVPVATTVVLSRLAAAPLPGLGTRAAWLASGAVTGVFVAAGVWISAARLAFVSGAEEADMIGYINRTKRAGDVYFIPVSVPDLARTTRGSLSSDFKPLPDKRRDDRIIPVDLQGFRLATGAPIYVDFKAIPYKDADVIEWRERIRVAQTVQELLAAGCLYHPAALALLREKGVTHLVLPASAGPLAWGYEPDFEDRYYRVYSLRAPPRSP